MKSELFLDLLTAEGFNYFTGVPCSYLKNFVKLLDKQPYHIHTPALREDLAVGLATGAFLGGRLPVIYMQNSGLGYSLEAFTTLHLIYRIPALILITHRGPDDTGWEEHRIMGEHTGALLETFHLKYSQLDESFSRDTIREIKTFIMERETPWFMLIPSGGLT